MPRERNTVVVGFDELFNHVQKIRSTIPKQERSKYKLNDLKVGACFRFEKLLWKIIGIDQYREKDGFLWYELKLLCLHTGQISYMEWEIDDELDISFTIKQLDITDLHNQSQDKIRASEINRIANKEESIFFGFKEFTYYDDYKADYLHKGREPEHGKFFDFVGLDGFCVSIERWGTKNDYEYQVFYSREVINGEIEVVSTGDDNGKFN